MNYGEVIKAARGVIGDKCVACPICDGRACKNKMPGPGAKGLGYNAIHNYEAWRRIYLNMDTICPSLGIDTTIELFGKKFSYPFFAAPVGAVKQHYSDLYDDISYNEVLISACNEENIIAFTGDGVDPLVMEGATKAIKNAGGLGIPTIKPWNIDTLREKMALINDCKPLAVAMDIDGAGLPFLKNMTPPAGGKTVAELTEVISLCQKPFIIKGIMTAKGALKAMKAGAEAIVVSNHGGRVLDECPATADVLEEIVETVDGRMKILIDGGIRSGGDVFKALALGADGVLIARPFVVAVYGAGAAGVTAYVNKIGEELKDVMTMCGAANLREITRDMVRK